MKSEAKSWLLGGKQGFKTIRPSDLVFLFDMTHFEHDQDIIKTNILENFY